MKNFILNNAIVDIWKAASSPLEYLVALWISGLFVLAVGGWFTLLVNFIMNPSMFNGIQFGLIDYIP